MVTGEGQTRGQRAVCAIFVARRADVCAESHIEELSISYLTSIVSASIALSESLKFDGLGLIGAN